MKKEDVAGIIALLLVLSAALVAYVFVARTSSSQKDSHLRDTVHFLGGRIDSLERQRDLLSESAATLEEESAALRKRVRQIDAEIEIMRNVLTSAADGGGAVRFEWGRIRITTASGLVIIAILAFIWMLYNTWRREEVREVASADDISAAAGEEAPEEPVPGSVLEEEFPAEEGTGGPEEEPPSGEDETAPEGTAEEEEGKEEKKEDTEKGT